MDINTATVIGRKIKAFKHCEKMLAKIDKNGSAKVKLNCTGVEFIVHKNDAIYCRIQATKYALLDEIRSYELTSNSQQAIKKTTNGRTAPAPVGAAQLTPEEKLAERRAKHRECQRRYMEKKRREALNQNQE